MGILPRLLQNPEDFFSIWVKNIKHQEYGYPRVLDDIEKCHLGKFVTSLNNAILDE